MAAEVVWAVYKGDWSEGIGCQLFLDNRHMGGELRTIAVADEGLQAE
jgi:hypothetical protein